LDSIVQEIKKEVEEVPKSDPRYLNVCVEQTEFAPILFEDACKRILTRGGQVGFNSARN